MNKDLLIVVLAFVFIIFTLVAEYETQMQRLHVDILQQYCQHKVEEEIAEDPIEEDFVIESEGVIDD